MKAARDHRGIRRPLDPGPGALTEASDAVAKGLRLRDARKCLPTNTPVRLVGDSGVPG